MRQTNGYNLVLLAKGFKLGRLVALMPIDDQHPMRAFHTQSNMFIKVPTPLQGRLVIGPSIGSRLDDPVIGELSFREPFRKIVDPLNDQKWRETPSLGIDAFNRRSSFSITWLDRLAYSLSIGARNHHGSANNAHHEASLVKVVKIAVLNPILRLHVLNQLKPRANKLRIFARGSLKVVYAI